MIVAHEVTNQGSDRRQLANMTTQEKGKTPHRYWATVCRQCRMKPECTSGKERRIARWEHEEVLEAAQARLDRHPDMIRCYLV